jgi:8-oxo-dGTP diphosphatase
MMNYSHLTESAKKMGISRFVVAAVISSKSKVLLLERPKSDFMGGIYELPSGKVEDGESLNEALHREVLEETGIRIAEIENYLGYFDYESKSGKQTRQFNFSILAQDPIKVILQEHDEYAWVEKKDINCYPITDSVRGVLRLVWPD